MTARQYYSDGFIHAIEQTIEKVQSTYVCNLLKDALRGLSAPAAWQTPEKFFI